MRRALTAIAVGLFVLSIGATPSSAGGGGYWNPQWDQQRYWGNHHARPHAGPPRSYRGRQDWWHQGRWHHGYHGGHQGWWWVIGSSWYLYPGPVYPYPAPLAVVPAPVVVQPQVAAAPYCREYQGDAIIDGTNQRFYGTACLQPDGAWHIVP